MLSYSRAILEAVTDALDELELSYETDAEDGVCYLDIGNDDPLIRSLGVKISALDASFGVFSSISVGANVNDFELVVALMEFVTRVNARIAFGALVFDLDSGSIYYRSLHDCSGLDCPTSEMVCRALYSAVGVWRRAAKGLAGVLYNEQSGKAAIELCDFDE